MSATKILKNCTKNGNTYVGSGCYAVVMTAKNPKNVIKVGNNVNDPWLDYYRKIISTNQTNPYVPSVDSIFVGDDYYICIMEKLEPATGGNLYEIVQHIADYIRDETDEEDFLDYISLYPNEISLPDHLLYICRKIKEFTVFSSANEADDKEGNALDLHTGNVMFRDGQLVITDPWCEGTVNSGRFMDDWFFNNLSEKA